MGRQRFRGSVLAAAAALLLSASPARAAGPVVRTEAGSLEGATGDGYSAFLGIPYAAPPLGALRWKNPRPHAAWTGIRPAKAFGDLCLQGPTLGQGGIQGSEDCLFLNVYAPTTSMSPGAAKLPVMVWIPGGAFVVGGGSLYDGSALARKGVVLVTINYRLGPFGWLSHPALSAESGAGSGNYGLMDQQLALHWVKANIARFGGDPANVTIFGESAGGLSTCNQLVSPGAKGLFQKAIVESGPCVGTLTGQALAEAEKSGAAFAAKLGCTDPARAAACLRALPADKIFEAGKPAADDALSWAPIVGDAVVPKPPREAIASGALNKVPVINGTTHDEWATFVVGPDLAGHAQTPESYVAMLRRRFGTEADAVLAAYPVESYATPTLATVALFTDLNLACNGLALDRLLAGQVPLYAYEFADPHTISSGIEDPALPQGMGAFHAGEIIYVFQTDWGMFADWGKFKVADMDPGQRALSDRIVDYWTGLARRGDPNGSGAPAWPRFTGPDGPLQTLAPGRIAPGTGFAAAHKCDFWAKLSMVE